MGRGEGDFSKLCGGLANDTSLGAGGKGAGDTRSLCLGEDDLSMVDAGEDDTPTNIP